MTAAIAPTRCAVPHAYATSECTGCAPEPDRIERMCASFEAGFERGFNGAFHVVEYLTTGFYRRLPAAVVRIAIAVWDRLHGRR